VWSWRPDAGDKFSRDPIPAKVTVAKEPGQPGARSKPLNPLRREGRMIPATPVVTTVCYSQCTRAEGAAGTRPSLRPLIFEGRFHAQLGRICAARMRSLVISLSPSFAG
jgi:hypothetical protein